MHGVHVKYSTFGIIMVSFCLGIFVLWGIAAGVFSEDASFTINSDDDVVRNYDRSIGTNDITKKEPNTGTVFLKVFDNSIQIPANIRVYKNGEFIQSVYMSTGRHTFQNLEYGQYKFVVTDPDYNTIYSDAFPAQNDYDRFVGELELSPTAFIVNYGIHGETSKNELNIEDSIVDASMVLRVPERIVVDKSDIIVLKNPITVPDVSLKLVEGDDGFKIIHQGGDTLDLNNVGITVYQQGYSYYEVYEPVDVNDNMFSPGQQLTITLYGIRYDDLLLKSGMSVIPLDVRSTSTYVEIVDVSTGMFLADLSV